MEKDKKNYGKSILVVLLLLITMVALVFATYAWARYTSTATGNVQASIARWDVTLTSNSSQFVRQYEHVVREKMAPGTEGQIDIALNANDTDVNFDFEVALDLQNMVKPEHVRFYSDAGKTHELIYDTNNADANKIKGRVIVVDSTYGTKLNPPQIQFVTGYSNNNPTYGPTAALDSTNGNLSIYWDWAYDYDNYGMNNGASNSTVIPTPLPTDNAGYAAAVEAYDTQDTTDARDFNETVTTAGAGNKSGNDSVNTPAKTMVVNFTLTATQIRPTSTTYQPTPTPTPTP